MLFEDVLRSNCTTYIDKIVTPLTPYFMCHHYISTEVSPTNDKYIMCNIKPFISANDLITTRDYSRIQTGDIVQVQVDHFDFFYDTVLPFLKAAGKKIVLITSQWHMPQLMRSAKTDACLNDGTILLWMSQNPIYSAANHPKYVAIPYGFNHHSVDTYMRFVRQKSVCKEIELVNGPASVRSNIPPEHIRKKYDIFGKNSGPSLSYPLFLENLAKARFAISTAGDRDDCYRHYECIGLKTVPVSNIHYRDIFGDSMVYSTAEEMVRMVSDGTVPITYVEPNRDILTVAYWSGFLKNI